MTLPASTPRRHRWRAAAYLRRTVVTLLVFAQTAVATSTILAVLPYHGRTLLEQGIAVLFAILFGWVTTGFWISVLGFVVRRGGGDRRALVRRHPPEETPDGPAPRTAVVMPVYHEPVDRSFAGLRAVMRSLEKTGRAGQFEFFVLSDSRDPGVWLAEQQACAALCREPGVQGRLHYRRRVVNLHHKSGNVADFLRRWGRDFEFMVVLDADSLMAGTTLVELVRLMRLEPRVGLIQTVPAIVNGRSAFARAQQFASRAYGPVFSAGLAALVLGESAYWGHNAIIRVEPFMRHCGLRTLSGFGLFRGPISSHDFVEAAYMRRAGYEVWMEPELQGSFEESPPTLLDELARDRRWARGNLQHLWVLLTQRHIRTSHRLAFLNGVMSYAASPLWMGFLVLSALEVTRFTLWPIDYFPPGHTLVPLWPEWHPHLALQLAGSTAMVLLLPKLLAAADTLLRGKRRAFGGAWRLLASVALEFLVSTVLAPIRMLTHTRFVAEALANVSFRWAGQNRSDETSWRTALRQHGPGAVAGAAWAGFALWLRPLYFAWSLPVVLPLVLAAPVSVLLSRVSAGERLRRRGLLTVPEDRALPEVVEEQHRALERPWPPTGPEAVRRAVVDPVLNAVHVALGRHRGGERERLRELARRCLEEGPEALSTVELDRLAQDAEGLAWLHRGAWAAPPDSYWGRLVDGGPTGA